MVLLAHKQGQLKRSGAAAAFFGKHSALPAADTSAQDTAATAAAAGPTAPAATVAGTASKPRSTVARSNKNRSTATKPPPQQANMNRYLQQRKASSGTAAPGQAAALAAGSGNSSAAAAAAAGEAKAATAAAGSSSPASAQVSVPQADAADGAGGGGAAAGGDCTASTNSRLQLMGVWHEEGFNWSALDNSTATAAYQAAGAQRWELQGFMLEGQKAEGILSLDHVMEVAKRMLGGYKGMLIACGAAGNVLGYWPVYSTSLEDVRTQLQQLNERERASTGKVTKQARPLLLPVHCCLLV